jgi:hypothetical protein
LTVPPDLMERFSALAKLKGTTGPEALSALIEAEIERGERELSVGGVHPWNKFAMILLHWFKDIFGSQDAIQTPTARTKVALFIAHKMSRRTVAVTHLFKMGMYPESVPLVRAAYEDWLTAGYLLLRPGEDHCSDFWHEDQNRLMAKSFRGTTALIGADAEKFVEPKTRAAFAKYLPLSNKQLRPLGGAQWSGMAEHLGLKDVHDWVYTHLSGLSHGSPLNARLMIGKGKIDPKNAYAEPFVRDEEHEHLPAFWAFWFGLRALTLAAREFGKSIEDESDGVLESLAKVAPNPVHCVAQKEKWVEAVPSSSD